MADRPNSTLDTFFFSFVALLGKSTADAEINPKWDKGETKTFEALKKAHAKQHPDIFADGAITFSEFVRLQEGGDEYISTSEGQSLVENSEHLLTRAQRKHYILRSIDDSSIYRHVYKHGVDALARVYRAAGPELFKYEFGRTLKMVENDEEAFQEIMTLAEDLGVNAKDVFDYNFISVLSAFLKSGAELSLLTDLIRKTPQHRGFSLNQALKTLLPLMKTKQGCEEVVSQLRRANAQVKQSSFFHSTIPALQSLLNRDRRTFKKSMDILLRFDAYREKAATFSWRNDKNSFFFRYVLPAYAPLMGRDIETFRRVLKKFSDYSRFDGSNKWANYAALAPLMTRSEEEFDEGLDQFKRIIITDQATPGIVALVPNLAPLLTRSISDLRSYTDRLIEMAKGSEGNESFLLYDVILKNVAPLMAQDHATFDRVAAHSQKVFAEWKKTGLYNGYARFCLFFSKIMSRSIEDFYRATAAIGQLGSMLGSVRARVDRVIEFILNHDFLKKDIDSLERGTAALVKMSRDLKKEARTGFWTSLAQNWRVPVRSLEHLEFLAGEFERLHRTYGDYAHFIYRGRKGGDNIFHFISPFFFDEGFSQHAQNVLEIGLILFGEKDDKKKTRSYSWNLLRETFGIFDISNREIVEKLSGMNRRQIEQRIVLYEREHLLRNLNKGNSLRDLTWRDDEFRDVMRQECLTIVRGSSLIGSRRRKEEPLWMKQGATEWLLTDLKNLVDVEERTFDLRAVSLKVARVLYLAATTKMEGGTLEDDVQRRFSFGKNSNEKANAIRDYRDLLLDDIFAKALAIAERYHSSQDPLHNTLARGLAVNMNFMLEEKMPVAVKQAARIQALVGTPNKPDTSLFSDGRYVAKIFFQERIKQDLWQRMYINERHDYTMESFQLAIRRSETGNYEKEKLISIAAREEKTLMGRYRKHAPLFDQLKERGREITVEKLISFLETHEQNGIVMTASLPDG